MVTLKNDGSRHALLSNPTLQIKDSDPSSLPVALSGRRGPGNRRTEYASFLIEILFRPVGTRSSWHIIYGYIRCGN